MKFCPKCGAILIKKTKNYGCPRCSYSTTEKIKIDASEKTKTSEKISVISEKDQETRPIIESRCKKCGNDKAYFWTVQTRAGDESETKFFKCTKCDHTWREYD
jgi:transcription factor S